MNPDQARIIFELLDKHYPLADTRLHYNTLFELLVAVILSAQSTDEQVNQVTKELFKHLKLPHDFAECELETLEALIHGVGLYRNKAKNLKAMSQIIRDKYHNQVPDNWDDLLKLPGVGRKTANVMLTVGFDLPGLGVDTHVHRVSNRLGLVNSKNVRNTEKQLKELFPDTLWGKLHHLLIYHGRNHCRSRKAKCTTCFLEPLCEKTLS